MRLLKTILETVQEKLLDICDSAFDLFEKGCEPLPVTPLELWLYNRPEPRKYINPIAPGGMF